MSAIPKATSSNSRGRHGTGDRLCLALAAHDEAELRRHLAHHHVAIIEEGIHGGSRGESLSLYVRDPSGNVIELKGPPPA